MALGPNFDASPALSRYLSVPERERASRFKFAEDRDAFIAAHALLRCMLSEEAGPAPEEWRFQQADGGKPEIDRSMGQDGLQFSLSHARGLVACAVTRRCALGIDVEYYARPIPAIGLAERFFARSEAEWLASQPAADRNRMFCRLWTLKEAYLKATGQGLAIPLNSFFFTLDPISVAFTAAQTESGQDWQFAERDPCTGHALSLAVRRSAADPCQVDARLVTPRDCLSPLGTRRPA
jgi:4'-phosphopantetheinyl transferase